MAIPFYDEIVTVANQVGPPTGLDFSGWLSLIPAIIQKESTFNPNAVSYTGAGLGLMQVNPAIWLKIWNITKEQLFDPYTNIFIGSTILRDYINQYGVTGGLGAYFAGPTNRLSQAAAIYASTVLKFWNSFKNSISRIIGARSSSQFYFVNSASETDLVSQYLVNDSGRSELTYTDDSTDWSSFLTVAGFALILLLVIDR
jgi:hypothetical protein